MTSWLRGSIVSCALGGAFVLTVARQTLSKRANLHRRPQAHRRVRPPEPGRVEAAERVRGRAGARSQGLRERKVRRPVRVRPVRVRKRRPRPVVVRAQEPAHRGGRRGGGGGNPPPIAWAAPALPEGIVMAESAVPAHRNLRLVVTKGLSHPWGMAFLPDGNILITERAGCLRIVRNGVLDPKPLGGVPAVAAQGLAGLLDIALHPRFAENKFVYLTYHKPNRGARRCGGAAAPARAEAVHRQA